MDFKQHKKELFIIMVALLILISGIHLIFTKLTFDVQLYYNYAKCSFLNDNCNLEYPPFTAILFLFLFLFFKNVNLFSYFFYIFILFMILSIMKFYYNSPKKLIIYTISSLIFIISILMFERFDLFAAFFVFLSCLALKRRNKTYSFIFLAISTMIKLYPLIFLPFYLIYVKKEDRIKGLIAFIICIYAFILIFTIILPNQNPFYFISYNLKRPIQIESSWASLDFIIPNHISQTIFSFGSINIITKNQKIYSSFAFILFLAGYFLILYKYYKKDNLTLKILINNVVILTLLFIVTNKVFSPQYLIWLIPLFPLTLQEEKSGLNKLKIFFFLISCIIILIYFPIYYYKVVLYDSLFLTLILIKNICLIVLFFIYLKKDN